jgi:hypothetical protein
MRSIQIIAVIVFGIIILGACRATKSSRTIQQVISIKKDTTAVVIVHKDEQPDSLVQLHQVLGKMYAHHIDYTTFSARVKVEYSNQQGSQPGFTANIHMKKDSIIWLNITGPFGIDAFEVLITPDSVRIRDELKHTYQVRSLSYIQDMAEIPLDFKTLQDLLVGNLIFFDSTRVTSYRPGIRSTFLLSAGDLFKNLVTLTNTDGRVMHSKLDDVDPTRSRTADLVFDDYVSKAGMLFATTRSIGISEKTQVDIQLNFKTFEFNVPLTYPFYVPKRYKRIK